MNKINNIEIDVKVNKSSFYVLPLLDKFINLEFIDLMQNSYIYNNNEEKVFSILYKFSGSKEFVKFEERLFNNKYFLGHEDYDEYVLYKFELPSSVRNSLTLLLNQKCNLNLPNDKVAILNFAKKRGFSNVSIFDKYLNGEASVSKPDMKRETFSYWLKEERGFLDANELYQKRKKNE